MSLGVQSSAMLVRVLTFLKLSVVLATTILEDENISQTIPPKARFGVNYEAFNKVPGANFQVVNKIF